MTATPAHDVTDRTGATDAEFAQRIADYPADVAHAAMVEQVARAMRATRECQAGMAFGVPPDARDQFITALAAAAIAAMPTHPAVEEVKRVEEAHRAHRAQGAEERGQGICRTCLAPIWNEGGTVGRRKRDTGWSDRIERGGDSLVCFKARDYRHVPLTGREACIYDHALALAPQPADAEGTGR